VEELKQLTNKQDPTQQMLTLLELLQWVKDKEGIKLMLDIKANNPVMVLSKIHRALLDVRDDLDYWKGKIIFGLWKLNFYEYGYKSGLLNGFEVINITISPSIASYFLKYSLSLPAEYQLKAISLMTLATMAPEFKELYKDIMEPNEVSLYLWTLNTQEDFDIGYKLDCKSFITDKPEEARAAIKEYQDGKQVKIKQPSLLSVDGIKLNLRFRLFRVFEFVIFNDLLKYRLIAFAFRTMLKFVAHGQK
jgi:phosphatidylglycerol phospholipase C